MLERGVSPGGEDSVRAPELLIALAIWGTLGAVFGPGAWRHWHEPPPPPMRAGLSSDRYFDSTTAGVIFYTTDPNLALDTCTCSLPNPGVIPVGK